MPCWPVEQVHSLKLRRDDRRKRGDEAGTYQEPCLRESPSFMAARMSTKENELPKVEYLDGLQKNPKYRCYIGAKTVIRTGKSLAKNQQVDNT